MGNTNTPPHSQKPNLKPLRKPVFSSIELMFLKLTG